MKTLRPLRFLVGAASVFALVAFARAETAADPKTKEASHLTAPAEFKKSTEEELAHITHPELRLEILRRAEEDQKARRAMK